MAAAEAALRIDVVYCAAPGQTDQVHLELAAGAVLADALRASGLLQRHSLAPERLQAGVWGRIQPPDWPLRDCDRVEIYRPLQVDPKEARRQRSRDQRLKSAG